VPEKRPFCLIVESSLMKKRRSKILFAITVLFSVLFIVVIYRHPIILKWMKGSARLVGLPMRAKVYSDDKIDHQIKVFHSDSYWDGRKAEYYILYIISPYTYKTKHIIRLDIRDKNAWVPAKTDKTAFDLVFGILFQGETGTQFSDFRDEVNGYGFDPDINVSGRNIRFNLPSKYRNEPSLIRIEFSQ
jgi:hypothetical protein